MMQKTIEDDFDKLLFIVDRKRVILSFVTKSHFDDIYRYLSLDRDIYRDPVRYLHANFF
jgi:hypothetical protein